MEAMVQGSPLDWCILRGGLFYGPQTFEDSWRAAARNGSLELPGDGSHRLSLIHPVDMATAMVLATDAIPARTIYHVVDDAPLSYRELFAYVAMLTGGPPPRAGGALFLPSFAASNRRIKTALNWRPSYSSYRSGMT